MKKFIIIFFILCLIFFTAIIKNSTKKFEDEIFAVKENIQILKKEFEDIKLEHDYLSSAENLLEFHNLYFDDDLKKKDISEIKIIYKNQNNLVVRQLKFRNE
tara:strand:+ start:250 stop:555 length:306 start_codon:yes stop_codon:yes gene_type:complete